MFFSRRAKKRKIRVWILLLELLHNETLEFLTRPVAELYNSLGIFDARKSVHKNSSLGSKKFHFSPLLVVSLYAMFFMRKKENPCFWILLS